MQHAILRTCMRTERHSHAMACTHTRTHTTLYRILAHRKLETSSSVQCAGTREVMPRAYAANMSFRIEKDAICASTTVESDDGMHSGPIAGVMRHSLSDSRHYVSLTKKSK